MSSNHDLGVYVLQVYAGAVGGSAPDVLAQYAAKYGDDSITELGALSGGTNVSSVVKKVVTGNMSASLPAKVDMTQAFLDAGGTMPATTTLIAQGVSDAASEAASVGFSTLKYVAIIALVLGAGYIAWQAGVLKSAIPRRA